MTDNPRERAVIVAAVSSEDQADPDLPSLDEQEAICRRYCQRAGDMIVDVIRIEGHSRFYTRLDKLCQDSPDYARLVEMMESDQITKVVAENYHRLWRRAALQSQVCALADDHDIWLYSVRQPTQRGEEQSTMWIRTIYGLNAEQDIKELVIKRRRGMLGRIKRQKTTSYNAPYGYRTVGRQRDAHLVVDEGKRRWVERVFQLRAEGRGYIWIARQLNNSHVPGPKGRPWSISGLRHMLYNPVYIGQVRQRHWGDPRGSRSRSSLRGEQCRHAWSAPEVTSDEDGLTIRTFTCEHCGRLLLREYVGPGNHEALISQQLWDAVQRINDARRRNYSRRNRVPRLYSGIVRCAHCGDSMSYHDAKGSLVLRCSRYTRMTAASGPRPCRPNSYRVHVLHEYVLSLLKTALEDPETWARQFDQQGADREREQHIAAIQREIVSLQQRRHNLLEAIELSGSAQDRQDFVERYDALNQQRQRCLAELAALERDAQRVGTLRHLLIEWQHAAADLDQRTDEQLRPMIVQLISRILLAHDQPPIILWMGLDPDPGRRSIRPKVKKEVVT